MAVQHELSDITLFVRNLPFDTTNEKLEELFSDIGPVKRCFVVKEKGFDTCRGFGYVTFASRGDAEKALKKVLKLGGRKLTIQYANKRLGAKEKKIKKKVKAEVSTENQAEVKERKVNEAEKKRTAQDLKEQRRAACIIVISQLPKSLSQDDLKDELKGIPKMADIKVMNDSGGCNTASIRFKDKRGAVGGLKKIKQIKIKGKNYEARMLSQEMQKPLKAVKRARIIIRNLSYKATKEDVEEPFKKFGEISEITIPTQKDGKALGFGFVQFISLKCAGNAINEMNGKLIKGRPVAVDWAIGKDRYQTAQKSQPSKAQSDEDDSDSSADNEKTREDSEESSSEDEDVNSDDEESSSEGEEVRQMKKPKKTSQSSSEEDDTDDEAQQHDDDDSDDSDDENDNSDEGFEDDSSSEEDEKEVKVKKTKSNASRKSDVDQGRTLFIRNLSFDTEEEDLGEFCEEFGDLTYCRIVMDKNTFHSKGTAFVQFSDKEVAEKFLKAASEEAEGLTLDGRKLNVSVAIERSKAEELNQAKKAKEPKDKRNLHLAREGMIRPGTEAAIGLAKADLDKRMKIEKAKKQKLRMPHIFISATRLCVHNLPTSVGDNQLKQICLQAAEDKTAKISESRVMRDVKRVNSKGIGKSMGFAFVNFSQHEHALQALRKLNNNPDIFGDKKRPIVEFSLENKIALNQKQKRLERLQVKQGTKRKPDSGKVENPPKKQRVVQGKHTTVLAPATGPDGKKLPKGLPSHWGPKIRHKKRNSANKGQKPSQTQKNVSAQTSTTEQPKKKKKKQKPKKKARVQSSDDFDKLVNKYKSTLMQASSSSKQQRPASKWFQS